MVRLSNLLEFLWHLAFSDSHSEQQNVIRSCLNSKDFSSSSFLLVLTKNYDRSSGEGDQMASVGIGVQVFGRLEASYYGSRRYYRSRSSRSVHSVKV